MQQIWNRPLSNLPVFTSPDINDIIAERRNRTSKPNSLQLSKRPFDLLYMQKIFITKLLYSKHPNIQSKLLIYFNIYY